MKRTLLTTLALACGLALVTTARAQEQHNVVRVIENPTPHWTAYDVKFFNVKMPEGTKMMLQERAYTSPIWYTAET